MAAEHDHHLTIFEGEADSRLGQRRMAGRHSQEMKTASPRGARSTLFHELSGHIQSLRHKERSIYFWFAILIVPIENPLRCAWNNFIENASPFHFGVRAIVLGCAEGMPFLFGQWLVLLLLLSTDVRRRKFSRSRSFLLGMVAYYGCLVGFSLIIILAFGFLLPDT